jgi:GWxTD domain-containing protein
MKKILLIIVFLGTLVLSCRTGKISTQNISYLYEKDMRPYIPEYTAFHKSDSISTIYFRINSGSLLYVKELNAEVFTSKFSVKAELFESYEMKTILDSNTVSYTDMDNTSKRDITGNLDIKARTPGEYLLKLTFADQNKQTTVESYLDIYRNSPNSAQNFKMLGEDSLLRFKQWVTAEEQFRIESNNNKLEKLYVGFYDRLFPIALPPFSVANTKPFDFTPDSLFSVTLTNGSTPSLQFKKKGIYFFMTDTTSHDGFAVFRFDENFPKVGTITQMLQPLKYLTTKYEYDDMVMAKNKKEAIDRFWLDAAGTPDRAKEMIKLYYNRVQDANRMFTSYIEGWKTDMGIIYMIYGEPNVVYRAKNMENWVYGEDRNLLSITFSFFKVRNPFTDNDYSLSRSPVYKDGWYLAVDNWRR